MAGASSPGPDKMVKTDSVRYSSPSQQDRWPLYNHPHTGSADASSYANIKSNRYDHPHTGSADPTSYNSHSRQDGEQRMSPGISDAHAARPAGQAEGRRVLSELHDRAGVVHRASPEKTGGHTGQAADGTAAMEVDTAMDTAEGVSGRASGVWERLQFTQRDQRQAGTSPAKEQQEVQSASIGQSHSLS